MTLSNNKNADEKSIETDEQQNDDYASSGKPQIGLIEKGSAKESGKMMVPDKNDI